MTIRTTSIFFLIMALFQTDFLFARSFEQQKKTSLLKLAEKISNERVGANKVKNKCSDIYLEFLEQIESQNTFVRGEILDTQKQDQIDLFHANLSNWFTDKTCVWRNKSKSKQLRLIFNYFADLTYDENSFLSLKAIIRYRQQFLKSIYLNRADLANQKISCLDLVSLRLPLPLARILTSEIQGWAQKPLPRKLSRLNLSFQKNPYQSLNSLYSSEQLSLPDTAKNLWTELDVQNAKEQLTIVSALAIEFASIEYEKKTKLKVSKLEDLVTLGLLQLIPLNYNTGQSFKLNELQILQTL